MKKGLIYVFVFLFLNSCQEETLPIETLYGSWKVDQVYENHKLKDLGAGLILFRFSKNGRYTYGSQSKNAEAGSYFLKGKQLHTKDTLNPQAIKKAVSITMLSQDSLFLDMNRGGVPQLWKCVRE
ncbi:MAG: hypothetical protein ACI8YQ_003327 [Polaribacter sp.]|jgi:hypothetical protein